MAETYIENLNVGDVIRFYGNLYTVIEVHDEVAEFSPSLVLPRYSGVTVERADVLPDGLPDGVYVAVCVAPENAIAWVKRRGEWSRLVPDFVDRPHWSETPEANYGAGWEKKIVRLVAEK